VCLSHPDVDILARQRASGARGMRGDRVGVGDNGEVPGGTRGSARRRKRDVGVVGGLYCGERNDKSPFPTSPHTDTSETQDLAAMRRLELRYFTEREGEK
jgi:hypothetical protein